MAGSDITIEILKEIRETTRATSARLDSMEVSFNSRLDITNERLEIVTDRLDVMSERLDLVETTILDVVRESRSTARYTRLLARQQAKLAAREGAREPRRQARVQVEVRSAGAYSANGSTQGLAVGASDWAAAADWTWTARTGRGRATRAAGLASGRRAGRIVGVSDNAATSAGGGEIGWMSKGGAGGVGAIWAGAIGANASGRRGSAR